MEEKKLKIILNKSGKGNINPRIPMPISWFKILGLSEEDNEVKAIIDEENKQIIIKKEK